MGLSISKLLESWHGENDMSILMLGLDAAGKTSILYKIRLEEAVSPPTIGYGFETIKYKSIRFTVWDLGGYEKIRNTKGLIFVVDSADKQRIDFARQEIIRMLDEEELRDVPFLVLANKQDLGVMSVLEISEKLGLHTLKGREWHIQGTCALTGDGLYEGLDWLEKVLSKKY